MIRVFIFNVFQTYSILTLPCRQIMQIKLKILITEMLKFRKGNSVLLNLSS